MDIDEPMVFTDADVPLTKREIVAQKRDARHEATAPPRQAPLRKPILVEAPCANCGTSFRAKRSDKPFCRLQCKDEAKAVRYTREKHREYPSGIPEQIEEAIRMKVARAWWWLRLGGQAPRAGDPRRSH